MPSSRQRIFPAPKNQRRTGRPSWCAGLIEPSHGVPIGMRGNPRTLDWWKIASDLGYEVVPARRYREPGAERTMAMIDERIGDTSLYITFDPGCLDPTVCPGVANLECGIQGFQVDEVMQLLRSMRGKNVFGGDVTSLIADNLAAGRDGR